MGDYFTIAEFRQFMPDMDEANYPDERVTFAQDAVEATIENVCGTSFVARTVTETVSGSGGNGITLGSRFVISVTSVTENGVLQSGYTYAFKFGVLERKATGSYWPTVWVPGDQNITVVYTAGYSSTCPDDLKLAAMEATRDKVMQLRERSGKPSERATSITNEFGNFAMSVADDDEHPTGIPSVDAVIMRYAPNTAVFGFA